VQALQRAVLEALRKGAELSPSHREGGTVIHHDGSAYLATDHAESSTQRRFVAEAEALDFLWRYFEFENRRDAAPGARPWVQRGAGRLAPPTGIEPVSSA
jgi:hypothetical protein